jgi:PilZ domain
MHQATHGNASSHVGTIADRRDDRREEVFLKTILITGRDQFAPAELVNISHTGFLVRTRVEFKKHDRLRLALPVVGDLPAEVAWSLAGCAGCRFIYSLNDTDYILLLSAIRIAKPDWRDAPR